MKEIESNRWPFGRYGLHISPYSWKFYWTLAKFSTMWIIWWTNDQISCAHTIFWIFVGVTFPSEVFESAECNIFELNKKKDIRSEPSQMSWSTLQRSLCQFNDVHKLFSFRTFACFKHFCSLIWWLAVYRYIFNTQQIMLNVKFSL